MWDLEAPKGDADRVLSFSMNLILNASGEPLHAKDEEVGRYGINLFYASRRVEVLSPITIYQDSHKKGGDIRHDEPGDVLWEAKEEKSVFNERPFNFVKGFLKIYLKDRVWIFVPFF